MRKVACITDDGRTISQHFGRAANYVVFTFEGDEIVHQELRSKMGHPQRQSPEQHGQEGRSGMGAESHRVHVSMAEAIADCEALLCRGMGYGAYQSMQSVGVTPVVTDVADAEEAARAYVAGDLQDHPEKLH